MTSLGKRNTSRAVFTSHERALAKANWSSNTARLNRESFLPFGSCSLCLEIAREPVSCQLGDIFCRECALTNLLAQKKELKRAQKSRRQAEKDIAQAQAAQDEEDQLRAVKDFELVQAGLLEAVPQQPTSEKLYKEENDASVSTGSKRKFTLDEEELSRIAAEDRRKARKAIEDDKVREIWIKVYWLLHDAKLWVLTSARLQNRYCHPSGRRP